MGANSTQAIGIVLFLLAFTLLAGAFAGWGLIAGVGFLVCLGISIFMFMKCKSMESEESKG
jgi:hypothetical protein